MSRPAASAVWCPSCEQLLARRSSVLLVEADCPRCRRRVPVAVRQLDLDGERVLVERVHLAAWRVGQAAGRARRELAASTLAQLDRPAVRRELAAT